MRAVLVGLATVFCASLLLLTPPAALSAPSTSHINSSWSKTICCKKEKNWFWSTERQCRLAKGGEAKAKACHDADAKTKACCKKEAKTWWSNRRDCRRTGVVVVDSFCAKPS
jgi:hypothetical protein